MKLILKDSLVEYEDGRILIEYDSTTDKPGEIEEIVKSVNNYSLLLDVVRQIVYLENKYAADRDVPPVFEWNDLVKFAKSTLAKTKEEA